jgi:hypothetical protein
MPWVAGKSGNPRGRPHKEQSVAGLMAEMADAKRTDAVVCRLEELVEKLFELAIEGDVAAARLVLAYLEGLPVTRVQAEVVRMPEFTADEAAEAERIWNDFRMELTAQQSEGFPQSGKWRGRDAGREAADAA